MELINLIAIIISVSAAFSYINYRFIKLPTTIGVLVIAIICSLILIVLSSLGFIEFEQKAELIVSSIDFDKTLMHGMLSFLLFAGALHVNVNELAKQKWVISSLASIGVIFSTFLIGSLTWVIFNLLNVNLDYIYCIVFGALISPTDPIAVLGILKKAGIPKSLETKVAGESLFNDGIGVVVFLVLYEIAFSGHKPGLGSVTTLFLTEAVGGAIYGFALGWGVYKLLKTVDNYHVEILLTLALVMGGYSLAMYLHLSGPIAVVIAGLLIGNRGRVFAMSDRTRENLDTFWELIDEILNVILFVLIGLEILILSFYKSYIYAALLIIPVILFSRFIVVFIPVTILKYLRDFSPNAIKIMTWGALRGGISVALALSIPAGAEREIIVSITYIVVVFSIVVQGLTISKLT
ncbi:MAG: sodium:proton antiporter [Candidatus Dadabacteria bacterium]|nr:sodium:proton antiporter [Candidatus Dadabacteria bacterium]NIS07974.1 sodium:proton antiporter [Candidatus Dadabacteria bacterium]NIV43095.1 sodium:proton antiporter [Candidatus Dadabacteria bacterium]NIX14932.1 sodium:proton antiporter [Candidatus Dadabacteria bacterium]NIY21558.1 sodium:proton antiporter [Candidatus Dadabacteria bacterium]